MEFEYYSYHKNATGQEFFVPTQTLIAVKLLSGAFFSQWRETVMSKLPSIRLCPPTQVAALLVPIIAQQERTTRASAAGSRLGSGRRGGRQKQQKNDGRSGKGVVVAAAGQRLCQYDGVPLRAVSNAL